MSAVHKLQSAPMELLSCSAGVCARGMADSCTVAVAGTCAPQAGSWPGGVMLSPGLAGSSYHSCTFHTYAARAD